MSDQAHEVFQVCYLAFLKSVSEIHVIIGDFPNYFM